MNKLTLRKNNKGFSLVELIIVIAIMAVLTAVLAPQLLKYVERSREAKDDVLIDEINRSIMFALANEPVSAAVAGSNFKITIATSGKESTLKVEGASSTANQAVAADIASTLGGKVNGDTATIPSVRSSRAWIGSGSTAVFTVTYSGGSYNITNPTKATS